MEELSSDSESSSASSSSQYVLLLLTVAVVQRGILHPDVRSMEGLLVVLVCTVNTFCI